MASEIQDSLYSRFLAVPEVTLGTTPAAAAYVINAQVAAIRRNRSRKTPSVWTNSRRPHPSRIVAKDGALELMAPLQHDNCLPLLEAFMGGSRAAAITVTNTDINFDATANAIEQVGAGLGSFALGYMVHVSGAANAANNGWKGPILSAAAGALGVPAGQLVEEAAGASVTLETIPLLDSDTEKSLSVMWHGVKLEYRRAMRGAKVDTFGLDFNLEDFIGEKYTIMGRDPLEVASDIGSGTVAGTPKTTGYMTEADDIKRVRIGNVANGELDLALSTLAFQARNGRTPVRALGDGGVPRDHRFGVLGAEFTATAIADAAALTLQDIIDADETVWAYTSVEDPAGYGLCVLLAAAKAIGDLVPKESGSLVDFGDLRIDAHDPSKDSASDLYNSGSGPGFMLGIFFRTP